MIKNLTMGNNTAINDINQIYTLLSSNTKSEEEIFIEQAKKKGQTEEQAKETLQNIRQLWNSI